MGHYYEKTSNGVEPRHFVGVSSRPGELRPTRITDARKAGWYPSVTTVMGLLDKPALTDWKIQEHLKQAYALAQYVSLPTPRDFWIESVKRQTQSELEKAPKDGTDFHDSLERFVTRREYPKQHEPLCKAAWMAMEQNTNALACDFLVERSFVHSMGFAGKVDAIRIADERWPVNWICDWKTKNTADKWKPGKMAYPEMAMQLAAYRVGLGLDNARCANVFICLETGEVEFYEWGEETLNRQWANFADLLRIWLRNAEYVPGTV